MSTACYETLDQHEKTIGGSQRSGIGRRANSLGRREKCIEVKDFHGGGCEEDLRNGERFVREGSDR